MKSGWWLAGVAFLSACLGGAIGAGGLGEGAGAPPPAKEFEGYSSDLSFDKAVADAVSKAWAELSKSPEFPKADGMIRFTVVEIGGERGGFAGLNRLRVKISASM
jgi:hypothetical protein